MIINIIDTLANIIVLGVSMWAVLNKKINTGVVGTLCLSFLGMFSLISVLKPKQLELINQQSEMLIHVTLACFASWFFMKYRHFYKMRK